MSYKGVFYKLKRKYRDWPFMNMNLHLIFALRQKC